MITAQDLYNYSTHLLCKRWCIRDILKEMARLLVRIIMKVTEMIKAEQEQSWLAVQKKYFLLNCS